MFDAEKAVGTGESGRFGSIEPFAVRMNPQIIDNMFSEIIYFL